MCVLAAAGASQVDRTAAAVKLASIAKKTVFHNIFIKMGFHRLVCGIVALPLPLLPAINLRVLVQIHHKADD